MGGDFNVQLPRDVQGITGGWVWEEKQKGALYARQAEAILSFCSEFQIEAINTWMGGRQSGRAPRWGRKEVKRKMPR